MIQSRMRRPSARMTSSFQSLRLRTLLSVSIPVPIPSIITRTGGLSYLIPALAAAVGSIRRNALVALVRTEPSGSLRL